jgi:hypothetical protein
MEQTQFLKNYLLRNCAFLLFRRKMSDSLSEDELAELIRHGRINTSRAAAKRRSPRASSRDNNAQSQPGAQRARESPQRADTPILSENEPDPDWLKAQKEKAERNIAAPREDKRRRDEMREASKF